LLVSFSHKGKNSMFERKFGSGIRNMVMGIWK